MWSRDKRIVNCILQWIESDWHYLQLIDEKWNLSFWFRCALRLVVGQSIEMVVSETMRWDIHFIGPEFQLTALSSPALKYLCNQAICLVFPCRVSGRDPTSKHIKKGVHLSMSPTETHHSFLSCFQIEKEKQRAVMLHKSLDFSVLLKV